MTIHWIELNSLQQLIEIKELSKTRPQVIFKHSTRCAISSMAKSRLERNTQPTETDFYILDLLKYRPLSHKIATDFTVHHESPQVLLIKNTECIYEESHGGIQMDEIKAQMQIAP